MKALLFDLDNTLYPPEKDLFSLIDIRINRYMQDVVRITPDKVDGLRRRYWQDYGATLQGLVRHFSIDPEEYLDFVHDVDVKGRLAPDPELRQALADLPVARYVFTNGSREHAHQVIDALGLGGIFADIFDIRIANYQPKPSPDPYHNVLHALDLDARHCVMIEDSLNNLHTAKQLGMTTILVGQGPSASHVDQHVPDARSAAVALQSA